METESQRFSCVSSDFFQYLAPDWLQNRFSESSQRVISTVIRPVDILGIQEHESPLALLT